MDRLFFFTNDFELTNFTPKEDAFEAIDLYADDETAIQVKGVGKTEATVVETDAIAYPAIAFENKLLNARLENDLKRFKIKISEHNKRTQENLKGYLITIPYDQIDPVTGEPSENLIGTIKSKAGMILGGE